MRARGTRERGDSVRCVYVCASASTRRRGAPTQTDTDTDLREVFFHLFVTPFTRLRHPIQRRQTISPIGMLQKVCQHTSDIYTLDMYIYVSKTEMYIHIYLYIYTYMYTYMYMYTYTYTYTIPYTCTYTCICIYITYIYLY